VTRIEKASTERELLSLFLTRLQKLDPDIIIGKVIEYIVYRKV
jgi:DNA polymerase elongation subunit (family B)